MIAICILATPCALGFNVLSGVQIPGIGDIQSIEDFIVSSNIMPIGSLVFVMFCVSKRGWGWKNFLTEANTGQGRKFPTWLYKWMRYGVPVLVILILVAGWVPIVMQWFA
jgi:NSS family neurotransmitter:Na+ symporter